MTREKAKEICDMIETHGIEVIKAYGEGKVIQHLNLDGEWVDCDMPIAFSNNHSFRIKPDNEIDNYIHDKIAAVYKAGMSEVDKILLEYMEKNGLTIDDLQGNVVKREEENTELYEPYEHRITCWYRGDLIFSITNKLGMSQPLATTVTVIVEKGDW